jgi:hypothetical protein
MGGIVNGAVDEIRMTLFLYGAAADPHVGRGYGATYHIDPFAGRFVFRGQKEQTVPLLGHLTYPFGAGNGLHPQLVVYGDLPLGDDRCF